MVPRFRRRLIVISSLLLTLALTGCARVDLESEFEPDGGSRHTVTKTVDPTVFEDAFEGLRDFADEEDLPDEEALQDEVDNAIDREQIADDFDDLVLDAVDAGLQPERIDEPDAIGVRISTTAEPDADLGVTLNQLYSAISDDTDEIDAFSGDFTVIDGENEESRQQLELTVNGDVLVRPGALLSGFEDEDDIVQQAFFDSIEESLDEDPTGDDLREAFGLAYTVNMSGEIVDHNGTDLGDGRVQFDLPFRGSESFFVETEATAVEESEFPVALTLGIGGGILILAVIIGGGLVMMRNREPAVDA